jgi:hypothetical protein
MIANEEGLMLACVNISSSYAIKTLFLSWDDMQSSRHIKSAFLPELREKPRRLWRG